MSGHGSDPIFVECAVALPVHGSFHYKVPAPLASFMKIGLGVIVPFQKQEVSAFVLSTTSSPPEGIKEIKSVIGILDEEPFFGARQAEFYRFIARYYLAPLGEVIQTALPPGITSKAKKTARITERGRSALRSGSAGAKQRAVLANLDAKPDGMRVQALKSLLPSLGDQALRSMQEAGWIMLQSEWVPPATKKKIVDHYEIVDFVLAREAAAKMRRAPKQKQVIDFLLDSPAPEPSKEIEARLGFTPGAQLGELLKQKLVRKVKVEVYRVRECEPDYSPPPRLTHEQEVAADAVSKDVRAGKFRSHLLHGVTGSGKTEVYLRLVDAALQAGKTALVLVPEIGLTPQLLGRFVGRFGNVIEDSHSGIEKGVRYDLWRRILRKEVCVVVGVRSALFSPLENLGLIVVDEEHDASYKQGEGLLYNARDMAVYLAKISDCPVLLGSATPSLESYQAAVDGRYNLLKLTKRVHAKPMPKVAVIDLRPIEKTLKSIRPEKKEDDRPRARVVFSSVLEEALKETIAAKEQAIILLNRRGYSTFLFCLVCGAPVLCPNCDVSLKYHRERNVVSCHHCDYLNAPPKNCVTCGSERLFYAGLGTEQVEAALEEIVPGARVARMDRETVREREGHQKILKSFSLKQADILLGTQMVAKGHDFPNVTLVGMISADTTLSIPDFRSAERTFQLVTQVAGRAGRGRKTGRIIIQTYNPRHYAIACASTHDFEKFFSIESERRKLAEYPPFTRLALVRVSSLEREKALAAAEAISKIIKKTLRQRNLPKDYILGPTHSPLSRIKKRYRFQLLIKAPDPGTLKFLLGSFSGGGETVSFSGTEIEVDIDPQNVL